MLTFSSTGNPLVSLSLHKAPLMALPQLPCPLWLSSTLCYPTSNTSWRRGLFGNNSSVWHRFIPLAIQWPKGCSVCKVEFAIGRAASTQQPLQALCFQSYERSASRRAGSWVSPALAVLFLPRPAGDAARPQHTSLPAFRGDGP